MTGTTPIEDELILGIRECTECGKTDPEEEFGVRGIARVGGNLCVDCATELYRIEEDGNE